ncbi:MAG: extracellular solute-binding protein [Hyphomicrobiaceae bacterium]
MLEHAFRAIQAGLVAAVCVVSGEASATPPAETRHHGLSLVGRPAYPPGFAHFDWVNPAAPKGGRARLYDEGAFDNLNEFTAKGVTSIGVPLISAPLMEDSRDEPATAYCLICAWVSHPADYGAVTFGLRPEARFSDGRPITPEDVMWSMEAVKKAHPLYAFYYKNVVKAEKLGPHEVRFTFDKTGNRELPFIVGELTVLPKHYWEGTDAQGRKRNLSETTLEPPVGAGPYRFGRIDPGRSVTFRRIPDWWAKDLPLTQGQWNFDEIVVESFRERIAGFQAFKAGTIDFWREGSAKEWSTAYDVPPVRAGLIRRDRLKVDRVAPMLGLAFNLRRKQFQDRRVREAFNLAFDFETARRNLFFGLYERLGSYFENSELRATGVPQGRELELLRAAGEGVPAEAFTTEWKNPVAGTVGAHRENLRKAHRLLADAGWMIRDGRLVDQGGRPFTAEILLSAPAMERIALAIKEPLERLGMRISVRTVDASQYKRRTDRFDFDLVFEQVAQSISPGNEQREFFGSQAAGRIGSKNRAGIANPAIDRLIEALIFARDRAELVAATRALDRVLLWGHYMVPMWYSPEQWIAWWDRFGRPARMPSLDAAFTRVWWEDATRAEALARAAGRTNGRRAGG